MKISSTILLLLPACLLPVCLSTKINSRRERDLNLKLSFAYSALPGLLYKAVNVFDDIYETWNYLLQNQSSDITSALFKSKEHKVIARFLEISSKLNHLEAEVKEASDATITTILQAFPKMLKLELTLHELRLVINQVNFVHDQMNEYLILENKMTESLIPGQIAKYELPVNQSDGILYKANQRDDEISNRIMKTDANSKWLLERYTLEDFAAWATGLSYNSLRSLLKRMNDFVIPKTSQTLFEMINEISQVRPHIMQPSKKKTNCNRK